MEIFGRPELDFYAINERLWRLKEIDDIANLFIYEMFPAVWWAFTELGLNPIGGVAQSAHETDWGMFTGNTEAWFNNTCGLKVRDTRAVKAELAAKGAIVGEDFSLLHAQFGSWPEGALGQAQHVRAYTGHFLPSSARIVSPRYHIVRESRHKLRNWEEFGGGIPIRWAPSPEYGNKIVSLAQRIINAV